MTSALKLSLIMLGLCILTIVSSDKVRQSQKPAIADDTEIQPEKEEEKGIFTEIFDDTVGPVLRRGKYMQVLTSIKSTPEEKTDAFVKVMPLLKDDDQKQALTKKHIATLVLHKESASFIIGYYKKLIKKNKKGTALPKEQLDELFSLSHQVENITDEAWLKSKGINGWANHCLRYLPKDDPRSLTYLATLRDLVRNDSRLSDNINSKLIDLFIQAGDERAVSMVEAMLSKANPSNHRHNNTFKQALGIYRRMGRTKEYKKIIVDLAQTQKGTRWIPMVHLDLSLLEAAGKQDILNEIVKDLPPVKDPYYTSVFEILKARANGTPIPSPPAQPQLTVSWEEAIAQNAWLKDPVSGRYPRKGFMYKLSEPPTIDANLADTGWANQHRYGGFMISKKEGKKTVYTYKTPATLLSLGYTETDLYVSAHCLMPDPAAIKVDKTNPWKKECIELFLWNESQKDHIQVVVAPENTIKHYRKWKEKAEGKSAVTDNGWIAEIRIPAKALGLETLSPGQRLRLNITRGVSDGGSRGQWSWVGKNFHNRAGFGLFTLY